MSFITRRTLINSVRTSRLLQNKKGLLGSNLLSRFKKNKVSYSTSVQVDPAKETQDDFEGEFQQVSSENQFQNEEELLKAVEEHYAKNHIPLAVAPYQPYGPPYTDVEAVERIHPTRHVRPTTILDKLALGIMKTLRIFVHIVFRDKYVHHAVVLETVAAVPGMIAGMSRHFRSLRRMTRDHGWIGQLVEEAENERMHLLTWMQLCHPTFFERLLVITAQVLFTPFYAIVYALSPRFAHRFVGYLEEEAVDQYTNFLQAIDDGQIENVDAPEIAKKYWNLAPDAKLRDVVLCVRADEMMHRDFNHKLSTKCKNGVH
jgi:ubiquinol oxidase